ncbi:hypothetical protein [Rubripirellula amarantea]|uniref:hypothetical protein n=1 Tax=Rubripirellula amarantea TaxID=2527999 RepID=UPI0011B74AF8|nr:hypothetical protein [Rubripirellula amarantea]
MAIDEATCITSKSLFALGRTLRHVRQCTTERAERTFSVGIFSGDIQLAELAKDRRSNKHRRTSGQSVVVSSFGIKWTSRESVGFPAFLVSQGCPDETIITDSQISRTDAKPLTKPLMSSEITAAMG